MTGNESPRKGSKGFLSICYINSSLDVFSNALIVYERKISKSPHNVGHLQSSKINVSHKNRKTFGSNDLKM